MDKTFVIIVTYNGSKWIRKCLDSLKNSTHPVTPVIVDNNSTDDTVAIVRNEYPVAHLIERDINLGFGRANNIGINYSFNEGADFFFLLNQDAWVQPDAIEILVKASKLHPQYFVLSPLHLNGQGDALDYNFSLWISPPGCPGLFNDLVLKNVPQQDVYPVEFVNAAFWLLTRACVATVGGFDPVFSHYGEDNDYAYRVRFHGHRMGICPKAIGFHDRPQAPLDVERLTPEKKFTRKFNAHLIVLKDINRPFPLCMLKAANDHIIRCIKYSVKLRPADILMEMKISASVVSSLLNVYRHREASRSRGKSFIEVT